MGKKAFILLLHFIFIYPHYLNAIVLTSRVLAMGGFKRTKADSSTKLNKRTKVKLITFSPPIANTMLCVVAGIKSKHYE